MEDGRDAAVAARVDARPRTPTDKRRLGSLDALPIRSYRHPVDDRQGLARQIAPLTIDGYTRFSLTGWRSGDMHSQFRNLVSSLRVPLTAEQEAQYRRSGGRVVQLPISKDTIPLHATELQGDVYAEICVSGARQQILSFLVEGHFYLRLNVEASQALLQLKARGLWAAGAGTAGYAAVAEFWLGVWSVLLLGATLPQGQANYPRPLTGLLSPHPAGSCSLARALGWCCTGLEICADWVGLDFFRHDAESFVGIRRAGTDDETAKLPGSERVSVYGVVGSTAQTINLGSRSSPVSICIYDKTGEIVRVKGGDESTYSPIWSMNGYDHTAGQQVRRVEVRVAGYGLCIADESDSGEILDFRDPATAADRTAVSKLWKYATLRKRLVEKTHSRKREAPTDQRWQAVQDAAGTLSDFDVRSWKQHRHVQRGAHAQMIERARRDFLRAALRYAAAHDRVLRCDDAESEVQVREELSRLLDEARAHVSNIISDEEVGEAIGYSARYWERWQALLAPEIAAAGAAWVERSELAFKRLPQESLAVAYPKAGAEWPEES